MYEAAPDPDLYTGTTVLKNLPGFRTQDALDAFEAIITAQRADEPLPGGRLSATHYRAIHRHLFQDVYPWAGRYRTVRLAKHASVFCYPENIPTEMGRLFRELRGQGFLRKRSTRDFSTGLAHFLAEMRSIRFGRATVEPS